MTDLPYKRVLLKISGEALMGDQEFGICQDTVHRIAEQVKAGKELGVQLCLVIGGGNIFRGLSMAQSGMERASADYMGMLATVMNALAMQNALVNLGLNAQVMSAIAMPSVCETYIRSKALRHLNNDSILIFAAGTGNPFFTTDSGAALRAAEIGADALMKGTQVDGIYTADPKKDPNAERLDRLTYQEMFTRDIQVMDKAAVALTNENDIPIVVFSLKGEDCIRNVLQGRGTFSVVQND